MANISRRALELVSNLVEEGADPLEYMKLLEKQIAQSSWGTPVIKEADELFGIPAPSPDSMPHVYSYSGSYSSEYNEPYRLTRERIAADYEIRKSTLQWHIENYKKHLADTYGVDKIFYVEKLAEAEEQLKNLIKNPRASYGAKSAKLLKTFHPSANDAVVYRGLNPRSNTARRLNQLEDRYSAEADSFNMEAPIPAPTDYGNLGFLSTSIDSKVAKSFGDWRDLEDWDAVPDHESSWPSHQLYKILVPKGTPVRPLLGPLSENSQEAEVLLPPMSVYERLGPEDQAGFIPLLWIGRGKPMSKRYIGAGIPAGALIEQYRDAPEDR